MEPSDAEVVQRAAGGDADAFMLLVCRYRAPLIAYLHGKTGNRDDAEEISQETFCKAWEHLPKLRSPAAFAGWLYRMASNAVTTAARKPRPEPVVSQ